MASGGLLDREVFPYFLRRPSTIVWRTRTTPAKPSGIYGTEVCQICARLQTFHGWAAAMATHRFGRFACSQCVREVGEDEARRLLREGTTGFCEVCREPGAAISGQFLCERCSTAIGRGHPDRDVRVVVGELSRRRTLERKRTEWLEALDLNSEVAALARAEAADRDRQRRECLERLARERLVDRRARARGEATD